MKGPRGGLAGHAALLKRVEFSEYSIFRRRELLFLYMQ